MQSEKTKRKVFVSLLGTGFYNKCVYRYEKTALETRFIQHATLKMFGDGFWDKDRDKVIIFLTDEARKSNWDRTITTRETKDGSVVPYDSLETVLVNAGYEDMLITKSIPDGRTDEEMWEIFDAIYEELQDGDELYVDVTHGFRYLPMLMLVLMNYSRFLKNTEIMSVSYGNYEARAKNCEEAPIMQLLPIVELMDWTLAASDFVNVGNLDNLRQLTSRKVSILNRSAGENQDIKSGYGEVKNMVSKMFGISERIRFSDLRVITDRVLFDGSFVDTDYVFKPLRPILRRVVGEYNRFNHNDDFASLLSVVQWALKNKLYQQVITVFDEGLISYVARLCSPEKEFDRDYRCNIGDYINLVEKELEGKENSMDFSAKSFLVRMRKENPQLRDLDKRVVSCYAILHSIRNGINHAWTTQNLKTIESKIGKIMKALEICKQLYENNIIKSNQSQIDGQNEYSRIFINFSNHPYSGWSDVQIKAFADFGEVKEIPFPPIGPDWSSEKINEEADKYCMQILSISEDKDVTVHIMGEMTFCFAVVSRLKEAGIRCVASCSERNVTVEDGKKISQFDFVGYREY